MSSFICGNTVSAPIHGPGSGAAIAEPTLCVGFACGKKPKKPPLIPRRGPLWKPRGFKGVARDGFRSSQGNGSLLQYPFFLPERLIRAPVLKPRPRSQEGGSAENVYLARLPAVPGRFVGAACMRPVNLPPPPVPGIIDAIPSVCRGGIYASRQGCSTRGGCGKHDRIRRIVGRAFTPAEPIIFLIFIMCGGRERPPYRARQTTSAPATGNGRNVCGRHLCRPYA